MLAWASEGAVYRRDWEAALRLAEESAWVGDELDPVVDFWSSWMCGVRAHGARALRRGAAGVRRAVEIFEERVVDPDARLLANYSVALMYLDDFRGGLLAAEQAAAAARRHGAAPVLLFASSFELVARVVLGDWDRAQLDAAELHGLAVALDNRSEEQDFLWTAAYVRPLGGTMRAWPSFSPVHVTTASRAARGCSRSVARTRKARSRCWSRSSCRDRWPAMPTPI